MHMLTVYSGNEVQFVFRDKKNRSMYIEVAASYRLQFTMNMPCIISETITSILTVDYVINLIIH